MTGQIARVVQDKGYGFISGDDGQDYFFHRSAVQEDAEFGHLAPGTRVSFDVSHGPKGLRAEAVRVVR
jgi:CspA family cold shock protein